MKLNVDITANIIHELLRIVLNKEYTLTQEGWEPNEESINIVIDLKPGSQEPDAQDEMSTALE